MRSTRRSVLRAVGAAGVCGVAGTAAARGRSTRSDEGAWTHTYDADHTEYADAVTRTSDGYLLAGRSSDDGDTLEYFVLELGPDGDRRWATAFEHDVRGTVEAVVAAPDGAVVVGTDLGPRDAVTASWTPWAAKVDDSGVAWTYGKDRDAVERDHVLGGATRAGDGDVVVAGFVGLSDADAWMLRLAADGSTTREDTADLDRSSTFRDVAAVGDGGVVLGGSVGGPQDPTARLVRQAADGTTTWERTYDGAERPRLADVRSVAVDGDGFALGTTGVTGGDAGPTVARADGDGALRSTAYLFASPATAVGAVAPVDGGYLAGGNFVLEDSEHDYWLAAVGRDGGVRWAARYADGGYLGGLVGDGAKGLFAGSDGDDAVGRRFDPAGAPWEPAAESGGGTTTAAGTTSGTDGGGASQSNGSEAGDAESDQPSGSDDESNSSGMPGFGVGEAAAGIAGLELLRRRRS
ncbi:hypothetical protein [Halostella litorea]|uniref:hypothetical protein n=1 Tax=Halostella litorea TaxID=2528831 RepID=UPI001092194A|nr:hypothetical protein [Halostella litorea]